MKSNKSQTVAKDYATTEPLYIRRQGNRAPTGRPNLNDINKRNAEEMKQDRKSLYAKAGIIILLMVLVIVLVYFFS